MSSHVTTRAGQRRLSRPRWWWQRGVRAAALSLSLAAAVAGTLAAAPARATGGYVISATIPVGAYPAQVAFSPDGTHAYVTHWAAPGSPDEGVSNTVSVISTATNAVTATVGAVFHPVGVAVSPDGTSVYVTNPVVYGYGAGTVSVISTATNHVTTTIRGLCAPYGVAASPDGTHIYVTNNMDRGTVSVITRQ
jgi:YVTN family beta-propeller protein